MGTATAAARPKASSSAKVTFMTTVLIVLVVGALVVLIVRGLWSATSVQKGTGCPCCDKAMGVGHDHATASSKPEGKGKPDGDKA